MQGAAKVGLLVVVFVGLLIGAYTLLGRSLFAPEPDIYYAEFEDVGGTPPGTRVLMAGVPIGQVSGIELKGPKQAVMTLAINKGTRIPAGSMAVLPTSLIGFGDNPVHIEAPADPTVGTMAVGTTLKGSRTGALEGILPDTTETFKELNKTLAAARSLIEDERFKESLLALSESGNQTIKQFRRLGAQVESMLAENRRTLARTLSTAELAMGDVRRSTDMVAKLLEDPRYRDEAYAILQSLNATAKKADELVQNLNAFVTDPNLREPLNNIMSNAEKISESGTRIATDAEGIAKNTEKITANGVTISEEVITLSKKANEIADEAKGVLEKIRGFFDKAPGAGGFKPLEVGMDLLRETRPNYWRTDVNASFGVPGSGTSYHIGLFDAFESNQITAQIGTNIGGSNEFRYGIYASKPGVGVDYDIAPRLRLRGDLFNINDPRLDLRLRYDFGNGIIGWAGVDRLFGGNSPVIGIGVRK